MESMNESTSLKWPIGHNLGWRTREMGKSCSVQHAYTVEGCTRCVSFLLVVLCCIIHQLFLATDVPPFPLVIPMSTPSFILWCFTMYLISRFKCRFSRPYVLPVLGPAESSAGRSLFNPSRACVPSSLLRSRSLLLNYSHDARALVIIGL
jgi:hypothetical protein